MDQDSLDFQIKLNDQETVPQVSDDAKKIDIQSNQGSLSKQDTMASQNAGEEPSNAFDINQAAHPIICLFTFGFKLAAIFCYLFLNAMVDDKVYTFVMVLVLACMDFWVVKNVTARFLVGLRWWNEFDDEGREVWLYESMPINWQAHTVDKTIFWFSQIFATVFHVVMLLLNLFSILWALLNIICIVLYGTNFYGFYKCRGQHQNKAKEVMGKIGLKALGL